MSLTSLAPDPRLPAVRTRPAVAAPGTVVLVRNPWRRAVLAAAGIAIAASIGAGVVARYLPHHLNIAVVAALAAFALLVFAGGMHGRYHNRPPERVFRADQRKH